MTKKAIGLIAVIGLVILILTNLIGWSFLQLIHYNLEGILASFGLDDPNTKNLFIIFGAIIVILILGYFVKTKTNVMGWLK